MTKKRDLSTFTGDYVVVKSFWAWGENSHNKVRVAPIPQEGFPDGTRVQCSTKMRANYPVGTMFRLYLTVRDTGASPTLFAPSHADYTVVDSEEIKTAGEAKNMARSTSERREFEERCAWFQEHPAWLKTVPTGVCRPKGMKRSSKVFQRCPKVAAWVRHNSGGKCENCGRKAPFKDRYGHPFLEVHHVVPLAEGGPDTIENSVAVCPNCHRSFHLAGKAIELTEALTNKVGRIRLS